MHRLRISVGAMYVRRYFEQSTEMAAVEMVSGIRAQFEMLLAELPWMDAILKASTLEKLQAMYTHFGYPDELMDNQKLERFFSGLDVNPEEFLESLLRINVFDIDNKLNQLHRPVNETDWMTRVSPAVVYGGANYWPTKNSIRMYLNECVIRILICQCYRKFKSSRAIPNLT